MKPDPLYQQLQQVVTQLHRRLRQQNATLTPAQRSLVTRLVAAGPSSIGALATAEQVSDATVSRLIDSLEQKNLVRRARDKRDRRVVYAVATREGTAVSTGSEEACDLAQRLSDTPKAERQRLALALETIDRLVVDPVS